MKTIAQCAALGFLLALAASAGVRVYGRVVDSKSGEPIAKALVSIRDQALDTATDASGKFELYSVTPGTLELYISAAGYPLMKTRLDVLAGADLEVEFQFGDEALKHREQVMVTAGAPDTAAYQLQGTELRNLSTALFGDPLRSAKSLPGAGGADEFYAEFTYRGVGPGAKSPGTWTVCPPPTSISHVARGVAAGPQFRGDGALSDAALDRLTRTIRGRNVRLLVRCGDRFRVIPQRDIVYLSSCGGLTRLHTGDRAYVLDPTLNDLEDQLDPQLFYRISRSALVNLDCVTEVGPSCAGLADVVLRGGVRLEVSRRRLKELLDRIGGRATGQRVY